MRRIDLVEGDIMMILNQTIDLIQQLQSAMGHVLDDKNTWEQVSPIMIEGIYAENSIPSTVQKRNEQLQQQREYMERLRPLFAQASASLLHGIIAQSRTVPSMAIRIDAEEVPLDAEADRDAQGLSDPEVFSGDVSCYEQ